LVFHHPDGSSPAFNGGAPSVLVAYGVEAARRLERSSIPMSIVSGWATTQNAALF
jgi:hypothetical protein